MKHYEQLDSNNYVLDSNKVEHHDFYKKENHCCFCGHELEIRTQKKIRANNLVELPYCPSCKQMLGRRLHSIN